MRPVIRASTTLEESSSDAAFPSPFGLPPLASRTILFPPRIPRLLTDRPTGGMVGSAGPATGFPCSTLLRYGRCRVPPIPRDRGAPVTGIETPVTTAAFQRRVLFRGRTSHRPRFWLTRLTEVYSRSPFRPSPGLWPVDGTPALGLPPGLHTPPLPTTHARSGDERRALARVQPPRMRSSNRSFHSTNATSRRTSIAQ